MRESLARKEYTSVELTTAFLQHIKEKNDSLNAVLRVYGSALKDAEAIDARRAAGEDLGPLAGIPILLKDNILVHGEVVSAGSRMLEEYVAPYDATVVSRLRAAGAILLGSTNMDEFAFGSSTENSHFGTTKNPWNTECVPGGTSGGSAAAIAADFAPLALGSDTGGSIRLPASFCGITGLKPTYGRVSRYGLMADASSLDQIGPMARSVEDVLLLLQVIEGKDPLDATSSSEFEAVVPELMQKDLSGMKIGIPKQYFVEGMEEGVKTAVMEAVKELEKAGATIKEISLPHTEYALAAYYIIQTAEASSNLGRIDGMRYGFAASGETLTETYEKTRGEGFGKESQRRIMLGTYVLSKGYYDKYYRKALQVRSLLRKDFEEAYREVDVIVCPVAPTVAWKIGEKMSDPLAMYLSDIYTISVSLAGIPALSVPCGFSNGLPVGLQILGPHFGEAAIARVGMVYQAATDWHLRRV